MSPANSQVVYAASFGTLFRSADAGAHWDRVAAAPQSGNITDLAAGPDGTLYAATGNTGVYSSPDGLVWTSIGNGLSSLAVNSPGARSGGPGDPLRRHGSRRSRGLHLPAVIRSMIRPR